MKWNWGTGIVLAFVAFISFILYFAYIAMQDPRADHELVTEAYYSKDLEYQAELTAADNLETYGGEVSVLKIAEGLEIRLPEGMHHADISGSVSMYRPSNEKLDFELPLQFSGNRYIIPEDLLVEGRWNITVKWTYKGNPYLHRGRIIY